MTCRSVVVALALLGCNGSPTGPQVPVVLQLERLEPLADRQDEKLAIEVRAVAVEGQELSAEEYVPVTVRSTSGSALLARMTPALCDDFMHPGGLYRCSQLFVWLYDDRRIEDLLPLLRELDAQFLYLGLAIVRGTVHVFSGSVPMALAAIRAHPAVQHASTVYVGTSPGAVQGSGGASVFLGAVIRTTNSDENPRKLRINNGDTVTATYTQPYGSVLEVSGHVVRCFNFLNYCS